MTNFYPGRNPKTGRKYPAQPADNRLRKAAQIRNFSLLRIRGAAGALDWILCNFVRDPHMCKSLRGQVKHIAKHAEAAVIEDYERFKEYFQNE